MRILMLPTLPAVIALACAAARASDAADAARAPGISVVGVASVQVKPSVVEVSATLSAEAELANDARVKARDARQRVVDALAAKFPGVTVESRGVSLNPAVDPALAAAMQRQQILILNGAVVQGQQNQADANRRFGVTEQLRLVLKDADKLEMPKLVEVVVRLVDAARESGLQFAQPNAGIASPFSSAPVTPPGPLVVCRASDNAAAAREQAYKAAIDDAKQKASRLAELAGLKVGKVVGIQELDAPAGSATAAPSVQPAANAGQDAGLAAALIGELTLNVRLAVQFETVK